MALILCILKSSSNVHILSDKCHRYMKSDNDTQASVGSSPKNIIHTDEIFVDLPTSILDDPIIKQKLNKSFTINIIITHICMKQLELFGTVKKPLSII